jgi:hypothetical protein
MTSANLDASSGLFPDGVRELQLRCLEGDLFCWVMTQEWAKDRLVALPSAREAAQRELAVTLAREHGFSAGNAELTAQSLFDLAFRGAPEITGRGIGAVMPRPRIAPMPPPTQPAAIRW